MYIENRTEADQPPLNGIRVLDLSRILAGPWSTQTLADLGADVWKVEMPGRGDDTRSWLPPELNNESTYFMCTNRSKKSIAIDLKTETGQNLVQRLAAKADILVENYRLGTLDKFGLDYDTLAKINPRLIYCSISGYGRTGLRAAEPGYDFVIQAESGLMSITGTEDGEPMKLGVAITDLVTGMNAVQSILAALFAREKTGQGQLIDLALLDGAVSMLANVGMGYLAADADPERFGNAHPTVVPYQLVSAQDGHFALAVGNDIQFKALCHVLELPNLAQDERYISNRARVQNRKALIATLNHAFVTRPSAYWLKQLRANGIPAGMVRTIPEALNAPEIESRHLIANVKDARHGTLRLMRSPLNLRGTPPREPSAPPRLGEHTDHILSSVLNCTAEQLDAWREQAIIASERETSHGIPSP